MNKAINLFFKIKYIEDYFPVILLFIVFIIRSLSFHNAVMNWDESSDLRLGFELLNGNLPYLNLFSYKQPMLYLYNAFLVLFSFKELYLIRIIGIVFIYLPSLFLYKAGKKSVDKNFGILYSISFAFLMTISSAGFNIMKEHLASWSLVLAFLITLKSCYSKKDLSFLGFLISITLMTRLNLAIWGLGIFLFVFVRLFKQNSFKNICYKYFFLILGVMFPIFLLIMIYYFTDNIDSLYKNNITIPLYLANSTEQTFIEKTTTCVYSFKNHLSAFNIIFYLFSLSGVIIFFRKTINNDYFKRIFNIVLLNFLLITISIIETGNTCHAHYFMQLAIFLSLFFTITIYCLFKRWQKIFLRKVFLFFLIICGGISLIGSFLNEKNFYKEPFFYSKCSNVFDYISKSNYDLKDNYVLFIICNLGYVFLKAKKPTMIHHGSDIAKDYVLKAINSDSLSEFKKIFEKQPIFIIMPDYYEYFFVRNKNFKGKYFFRNELNKNYFLIRKIGDILIYERKVPNDI